MLKLYNTLSRSVEEFVPLQKDHVGFYSCGPTVYDFAHIGHARTYVFADILHRTLSCAGYHVKRVMNITDVGHLTSDSDSGEDKMEKGAKRENKSVWDIASFYTTDFFNMLKDLNIKKPEIICKATDYIPQMIKLIQSLEEKSFTYRIHDGIYFDTTRLPDYGKLTGTSLKELTKGLKAGARIEMVSGKRNPTDFALWKFSDSNSRRQMEWDSPWGVGFPGWHIECSAMSMEFLGSQLDIHSGGVDHIPIHHTNEIAQSEAATGLQFVRYWVHSEHLLVDGEKMSKSLKNFYRLNDIVKKGFDPIALRYLFLTTSYRQQQNFTWKALESAQTAFTNLKNRISEIHLSSLSRERESLSHTFRSEFLSGIFDDLNTAKALATVWSVVKSDIPPCDKLELISFFDEVLVLGLVREKSIRKDVQIPQNINSLVTLRNTLRSEKKWNDADSVRMKIEKLGYTIKDSTTGSFVVRTGK